VHLRIASSTGPKARFKRLQALFGTALDAILFADDRAVRRTSV